MLVGSSVVTHVRTLFLVAGCCLCISACGSGSSDEDLLVAISDDAIDPDAVVTGRLDVNGFVNQLEFDVDEDATLNGFFESLSTEGDAVQATGLDQGEFFSVFTIRSLPQNGLITLRSEGAAFQYDPTTDFSGSDSFIYADEDGTDVEVVINVNPVPDAPVLSLDIDNVANQGRPFSVILVATDADNDTVVFEASNLPDWLDLDSTTGVLSGVPRQSDVGTASGITLIARDSTGLTDTIDNFEVSVVDVNDPPMLNITQIPTIMHGRETVTFRVFPDDLDADSVALSVEPNPAFDSTVSNGGIELRIKDISQAESIALTIIARDERGAVTREVIPVKLFPRTVSGKGITVSGFREGRGIHVVILGDGYASDQQQAFRDHVDGVLENIRSDEGIAAHLGAFNVHMIETVSQQSGSDDSDERDIVDTAFDSAYNCKSVPRLVCADVLKLFEASLAEYPEVEQIILLVNDRRFGGSGNSGGRVAITSAFFPEIALHEMGHSLADLADEYVDPLILETVGVPAFEEGRYRNVSTSSDPAAVPWAHFIDPTLPLPQFAAEEGVGVFQGGLYRSTGVYRGTFDSRMRSFDKSFGPVNTEQWILRLYTLTEGVREITPSVQDLSIISGQFQGFGVDTIFGSEVQDILWTLNGEPLLPSGELSSFALAGVPAGTFAGDDERFTNAIGLQGGGAIDVLATDNLTRLAVSLPAGQHQLTLTVSDISGRIKVAPPHAGIFTRSWRINAL